MKIQNIIMSVVGLLTAVLPVSAQKVVLQKGEYWLDGDFDNRTSIALTDKWETELDVSSLCEGIHTLGFRASDSEGRWSSPNVHYFLRSGRTIEGNLPASYELWIDDDFDHRTTGVLTDGTADMELDLARLHTGLHHLTLRVKDTHGMWSTPTVKYFIVPEATYADNEIETFSYWFDGDITAAYRTKPTEDGTVYVEADVKHLSKGIHTLTCQATDKYGRLSSPMVRYFAVPDTLPAENAIGGYSYWFNRGPRIRITTAPANPLEIIDLIVEIKDVVPNEIPADYRFDVGTKTVYCNDNVFFGIEAYDLAGRSTQAVLSNTFPMTVPVRIDFRELENATPAIFDAPQAGHIGGFFMQAVSGDTLIWTINNDCSVDFYTEKGERINAEKQTDTEGLITFRMNAGSETTYALVHHAQMIPSKMEICCTRTIPTSAIAEHTEGFAYHADKTGLIVETTDSGILGIVGTTGITMYQNNLPAGSTRINLPSGIYLLLWNGSPVGKILVP